VCFISQGCSHVDPLLISTSVQPPVRPRFFFLGLLSLSIKHETLATRRSEKPQFAKLHSSGVHSTMDPLSASSTGDGTNVTVKGGVATYVDNYQCVTSHGNETVSDSASQTAVDHSSGKATLRPSSYDKDDRTTQQGTVHVPIHSPPGIWNQKLTLQNILVNFDEANDASVESVALYYDSKQVVLIKTSKRSSFHIDFTSTESSDYAYPVPNGICVTLKLKFPHADSSIDLYSVTLVYKAAL
jgi:hypothetical protein